MTKECLCDQCGQSFTRRAAETGRCARQFCSLKCSGTARRKYISIEQKKAQKAAYDKQYRAANLARLTRQKAEHYQANRDPEREREYRKSHMARHVEYCRRPEYRRLKADYDRALRDSEYGPFAEAYRLLLDVEKELRARATKYERLKAKGYFTRSAIQRRRQLWAMMKATQLLQQSI